MYIVTGGSGFFGQHLVRFLYEKGCSIKSLDVLSPAEKLKGVEYVVSDVRDKASLEAQISIDDIVVHNAALVPLSRDPKGFWEVNVEGTRHVVEAARAQKARKVIFVSSSSVYGVPLTSEALTEDSPFAPFEAYGKSKVAAEDICRAHKKDLDISIIRPRTIVGAGRMGILSLVFGWVGRNRPLMILGEGKNRYQLISPRDLAETVYRVSVASCQGEDFNVGTTRFGTLHQDLTEFLRGIGSRSHIHSVPGWFARAVLPVLSATRLVPFVKYQYTMADRDVYFSTEKMQRILGWVPTQSNSDMLVEAFTWYQKNPHVQGGSIHSRGLKAGLLRLLG